MAVKVLTRHLRCRYLQASQSLSGSLIAGNRGNDKIHVQQHSIDLQYRGLRLGFDWHPWLETIRSFWLVTPFRPLLFTVVLVLTPFSLVIRPLDLAVQILKADIKGFRWRGLHRRWWFLRFHHRSRW